MGRNAWSLKDRVSEKWMNLAGYWIEDQSHYWSILVRLGSRIRMPRSLRRRIRILPDLAFIPPLGVPKQRTVGYWTRTT